MYKCQHNQAPELLRVLWSVTWLFSNLHLDKQLFSVFCCPSCRTHTILTQFILKVKLKAAFEGDSVMYSWKILCFLFYCIVLQFVSSIVLSISNIKIFIIEVVFILSLVCFKSPYRDWNCRLAWAINAVMHGISLCYIRVPIQINIKWIN